MRNELNKIGINGLYHSVLYETKKTIKAKYYIIYLYGVLVDCVEANVLDLKLKGGTQTARGEDVTMKLYWFVSGQTLL